MRYDKNMRVTAGFAKGYNISVPQNVKELRPAQGIVRLAIFNILGERVKGKNCLDLYAGTGSLGLEALSRGAKSCEFVDISQKATEFIEKNLQHSHNLGRFSIHKEKVNRFLEKNPGKKYDLIFLDPPYADDVSYIFSLLSRHLKKGGVIVYLCGRGKILAPLANLKIINERTYGATVVSFLV